MEYHVDVMDSAAVDLKKAIGFDATRCRPVKLDDRYLELINLQLASLGEPIFGQTDDYPAMGLSQSIVEHFRAKDRFRPELRAPVDARIEGFLQSYFADLGGEPLRLPDRTFILSEHGLGRVLSIPPNVDYFRSDIVESYRLSQGVLHNPKKDRRTTQGVFHVTEGGLPIPADKKSVPRATFMRLFEAAMNPPSELLELPFTAGQEARAHMWVSLLIRPVIGPLVKGFREEQSMEVRFFAPGNLVCNLDFVESIFGNAGDPFLPENDALLDTRHWSGHTGCVILAPHLIHVRKVDMGLPHRSEASERQIRDGMCWETEDELYNDGTAFKLTVRDTRGVVVTLIADNYFGYCKKEVKTQVSYATNLAGLYEEEHAGGALAFQSWDCGEMFRLSEYMPEDDYPFAQVVARYGHRMSLQPEGYGVDRRYPEILYIPDGALFSLRDQRISWNADGEDREIKLLAGKTYILPNGYKVQLIKPAEGRRWRLIGTSPDATMCHKPCTVSGGGKSEISKSLADAIINAPFYVRNLREDLAYVNFILQREYGQRFRDVSRNKSKGRPILSPDRSLGSVIKMLTVSEEFTDEHNTFIESIPIHVKEFVLLVKRFYKPDWEADWHSRFSVDVINGEPGHELKYRNTPVITSYLRVGYAEDGSWRVFNLRKDFAPAAKIQMEDDITASVVAPADRIEGLGLAREGSYKVIFNCEYRLFQRPDDAVVRGYDKKTEYDMSQDGCFLSNYHPITKEEAREIVQDVVRFDYFTEPLKARIRSFAEDPGGPDYLACPAYPRIVDGVPTKNPRYLQTRIGLESPRERYIAEMGARLSRQLADDQAVPFPVNAVLPGRRNNPPEGAIRSLAVFNPIHYLPLPEAFMEFISSMTGKSPSTTGAGSEGALTKGPFNALLPIHDLNSALVSFVVTGYHPFITAAGYVGPKFRVDHDISLLVPEIWCRLWPEEREPAFLIENGCLEKVNDFKYGGRLIPASILGYRITRNFVHHYLGRIFSNPGVLFTEEMLRPEKQDMEVFVDGIDNIMTTHQRVAGYYFEDGSIDYACPPLRALLHIMRDGEYEGKTIQDEAVRRLFRREHVLGSDWYRTRLENLQRREQSRMESWEQQLQVSSISEEQRDRALQEVKAYLETVRRPDYVTTLVGTIGRDGIN